MPFDPSSAAALAMSEDPFSPNDDVSTTKFALLSAQFLMNHIRMVLGLSQTQLQLQETGSPSAPRSRMRIRHSSHLVTFGDFQSAEDGETTPTTTGSWTFAPGTEFGVFPEAGSSDERLEPSGSSGADETSSSGSASSAAQGSSSTATSKRNDVFK